MLKDKIFKKLIIFAILIFRILGFPTFLSRPTQKLAQIHPTFIQYQLQNDFFACGCPPKMFGDKNLNHIRGHNNLRKLAKKKIIRKLYAINFENCRLSILTKHYVLSLIDSIDDNMKTALSPIFENMT